MIKFLIHKPIAVVMTALGILILGFLAANYVPISLMPDIDIQEITIQVSDKNSSANELENAVIKPIRTSLLQVNHLEDIKSETSDGLGIIKLQFTYGTNIDYTFIEVNEKIDRIMSSLPRNINRPKVIKASASDIPVFYLNVNLKKEVPINQNGRVTKEFLQFSQFTDQVLRKRIEQISEVALVDVNGLVSPEIVVVPNLDKCKALGIDLNEIETVIRNQQIEIGSILVKDNQYQYNLRLETVLNSVSDIENIFLNKNDKLYQLKDIATVDERSQKRKGLVISNNKESISLAIIKQKDARIRNLKESLDESINSMVIDYPEINFEITRDQTKLLDVAIENLSQSLFWGILLAFGIMFLFLKDLKSPVLIAVVVPVSIVVCLLFFRVFNISINIISLSGLILGVGLMIDNAIIVIDNINQYREMGHSLSDSCIKGVNEVFRPLLSSVLTTCVVFIPLIFLRGITGVLFYDQAMAITIGLFASLLTSLTLLPVLYRLFYLTDRQFFKISTKLKRLRIMNYEILYEKGFRFLMKKQLVSLSFFFGLAILSVLLFYSLPKKTMPTLSSAETFIKIDWNTPVHAEENKERIIKLIESVQDSIYDYNAFVGEQQFLLGNDSEARTEEAILYTKMESPKKLKKLKNTIKQYFAANFPNSVYEFIQVDNVFNMIFSEKEAPLIAKIRSVDNVYDIQNTSINKVWSAIDNDLPNVNIQPLALEENIALVADKEKMMLYNVSSDILYNTLRSAFNEKEVSYINQNQNYVPIILGGEERDVKDVLNKTQIKANDTTYYSISDFVKELKTQNVKTIKAGKEGRYFEMKLDVNEEKPVMKKIKNIINQNKGLDVAFTGNIFKNKELINDLLIILVITLLLLYFILSSQFESLILPLIILIEIPIAASGSFLLLYVFDYSLNLMSMIGIVVMSGIIINDSILKMDTIIQLQRQGVGLLKALLVAGKRRLKPILMTSLTTIIALLPISFSGGLGAELQTPLTVSLIGGMLFGTIVSLYLIPLVYYHFSKKRKYAIS